ncbi:MAG: hypothetical protein ACLTCI_11495 [[Clostridium] nexile]
MCHRKVAKCEKLTEILNSDWDIYGGETCKKKELYATEKLCLLLLVEESSGKNTFHSDENGIIGYNGEDLKTKERT